MKKLILIILIILIGAAAFFFLTNTNDNTKTKIPNLLNNTKEQAIPENLSLPFVTEDINVNSGTINPLGVVRSSKDRTEIGHSGLDVPLTHGSAIFAVADGEVVGIDSADDQWNGMSVSQLLQKKEAGEGWAFLYEHIIPAKNLKIGSKLNRGDLVGTKVAPNGFTAHFQMSYFFNDYEFTNKDQCWPNLLDETSSTKFLEWWEEYKTSDTLTNAWLTNVEEEKYPFKELLDTERFPEGAQLCYPKGTDVR